MVECMLKDTDPVETCRFSNLHKIVLGINVTNLQSELESSTACIDHGDAQNRTSLWWATIRDDFEIVETLLSFGANQNITDFNGESPLHYAGTAAVCRALLSAGADVTLRSLDFQDTALHTICCNPRSLEVIDLLIDAGITVDVRDIYGRTPLLRAIRWG